MVQYRGPFVLQMPDEAWFNVNMMEKDMMLALELGRQVDVHLPMSAASTQMLTAARGMGFAEQDFAVVFLVLARMAGLGLNERTDGHQTYGSHLVSGYSNGIPFPAQYNGCAPYMGQGGTIISTVSNAQVYSGDSTSIQITTNNTNTYIVGQTVVIYGILGTTEANGTWIISTIVDANDFVLQGSTFSNAYISGGVVQQNYVNIYTTLNNSNGGPPTVALNNSDNPYQNWLITAGLDGSNNFQLTFTDNSGSTDTIAVVAVVRFVENNAT